MDISFDIFWIFLSVVLIFPYVPTINQQKNFDGDGVQGHYFVLLWSILHIAFNCDQAEQSEVYDVSGGGGVRPGCEIVSTLY